MKDYSAAVCSLQYKSTWKVITIGTCTALSTNAMLTEVILRREFVLKFSRGLLRRDYAAPKFECLSPARTSFVSKRSNSHSFLILWDFMRLPP